MTDDLHREHLGACRRAYDAPPDCERILLLGEDNPQSSAPEHALFCSPDGVAGHSLQAKIFDVERAHYLAMWRANLCCPTWSKSAARERALTLLSIGTPWRLIVCLGRKVAEAMEWAIDGIGPADGLGWWGEDGPTDVTMAPDRPVLVPTKLGAWTAVVARKHCRENMREDQPVTVLSLPHPSGRCRAWNAPAAAHRARALMADHAPSIAWGEYAAIGSAP